MTLLGTYLSKNYKTDKNTIHCYIEQVYDKIFPNTLSNILEIGAFDGGSALLWRDFFTNANIDIIDINVCEAILNQDRINHIVTDAYSLELVNSLPEYDLIIDDGPHTLGSMIFIIENYLKLLKSGGMCVIEDIQAYDWFEILISKIPREYSYEIIDLRNIKNRYDDMLLVIRKENS